MNKIAVLVPAYKEDNIILSTAENLLNLDYPRDSYDIFIIADSFEPQTLRRLQELPLKVIEVKFEKSTKSKSLNEAFQKIPPDYDIALICDADNIPAKDFLIKINNSFAAGIKAVQGKRVAKNLDSAFAILDACSEAIGNHIFRKGTNAIGLSSAVIGSGMAFDFMMIKNILAEIDAVGGFDKILQLKVVEQGEKIVFLDEALIFDEKVDSPQAFKHQRRRWVSSQFIYLKKFFRPAFQQLFKGNISYFNLAVANNIFLPRSYLFILLPLLILFTYLLYPSVLIVSLIIFILFLISLGLGIPRKLFTKELLFAIIMLPRAIGIMFGTLFQLRKANKSFIHTVHTKTEVDNKLYDNSSN